jgi:Flp pilus assembly pilin Flp
MSPSPRAAVRAEWRFIAAVLRDTRGAVQTEYTVVLVLVALLAAVAVGALSWPLLEYHRGITDQITAPVP